MAKKGLDYYQNYYQKLLLTCTTLSYIGWILILLVNIMSRAVYEGIGEVCSTRKLYNTIVTEYCEHCYMHYCFIIVLLFGLFALASK